MSFEPIRHLRVCGSNEYAALETLRALEGNPRVLSPGAAEKLDESLLSLGLFRPLLVWRDPGTETLSVIGGNQRFHRIRFLIEQGARLVFSVDGSPATGIPITVFEGSEERARLVALRDNNSDGEWDWTALATFTADLSERLTALADDSIGLDLAGFDPIVLEDLTAYTVDTPLFDAERVDKSPATPSLEEVEEEPETTSEAERTLSDPTMHEIKVTIGHVRGKLSASTYERLVAALALEGESARGEGLDAAFAALLDRVQ